jgi:hypothetical protein
MNATGLRLGGRSKTSVNLLLQTGDRKLLFPSDAQIENWAFTLRNPLHGFTRNGDDEVRQRKARPLSIPGWHAVIVIERASHLL